MVFLSLVFFWSGPNLVFSLVDMDWGALLSDVDVATIVARHAVVRMRVDRHVRLCRFPSPAPFLMIDRRTRARYRDLLSTLCELVFECPIAETSFVCELVRRPSEPNRFPWAWRVRFTSLETTTVVPATSLWCGASTSRGGFDGLCADFARVLGPADDGSRSLRDLGDLAHVARIAHDVRDCVPCLVDPIVSALTWMRQTESRYERSHRNAGARALGLDAPFVFVV